MVFNNDYGDNLHSNESDNNSIGYNADGANGVCFTNETIEQNLASSRNNMYMNNSNMYSEMNNSYDNMNCSSNMYNQVNNSSAFDMNNNINMDMNDNEHSYIMDNMNDNMSMNMNSNNHSYMMNNINNNMSGNMNNNNHSFMMDDMDNNMSMSMNSNNPSCMVNNMNNSMSMDMNNNNPSCVMDNMDNNMSVNMNNNMTYGMDNNMPVNMNNNMPFDMMGYNPDYMNNFNNTPDTVINCHNNQPNMNSTSNNKNSFDFNIILTDIRHFFSNLIAPETVDKVKNYFNNQFKNDLKNFFNLRNPKFVYACVSLVIIVALIFGISTSIKRSNELTNNDSANSNVNDNITPLANQMDYDNYDIEDSNEPQVFTTAQEDNIAEEPAEETDGNELDYEAMQDNNDNVSTVPEITPSETPATEAPVVTIEPTKEPTTDNSSDNTTDNNETTNQNSSTKDIDLTIGISSSWEHHGLNAYIYDITITNTGSVDITDWNALLSVPVGCRVDTGWNADIESSNEGFIASPVDWNKTISVNQTISFSVCLTSKETMDTNDISVTVRY